MYIGVYNVRVDKEGVFENHPKLYKSRFLGLSFFIDTWKMGSNYILNKTAAYSKFEFLVYLFLAKKNIQVV